jgi:hypothetical protein
MLAARSRASILLRKIDALGRNHVFSFQRKKADLSINSRTALKSSNIVGIVSQAAPRQRYL